MSLPRIIISLPEVMHTWDVNDRTPYFIGISNRVIIIYVLEVIWCGKEDLRDAVVSEIVYSLDMRG